MVGRRVVLAFVAILILAAACADGDGSASEDLENALGEVAAAHDEYYDEHEEYPDPFRFAEQTGVNMDQYEEWNIVTYYGRDYGYCIEGDDQQGTWHLTRDAEEAAKGECPR